MAYMALVKLSVDVELVYAVPICSDSKNRVFDYIKQQILHSKIEDEQGAIKILNASINKFDATIIRDDLSN